MCDLQTRPIGALSLRTALIQPSHRNLLQNHSLNGRRTQPDRGCTSGRKGRAFGWNNSAPAACMHMPSAQKLHILSWGTEGRVYSKANAVLGNCGGWAASERETARRRGKERDAAYGNGRGARGARMGRARRGALSHRLLQMTHRADGSLPLPPHPPPGPAPFTPLIRYSWPEHQSYRCSRSSSRLAVAVRVRRRL